MTGFLGRLRTLVVLCATAALALTAAAAPPAAWPAPPSPGKVTTHTIGYDHYSLQLDGKRVYLWGAEFHYWRLPSPDLWRDVLQKLKAGGFNAVSIYFDWAYHSPAPGVYDFTGVRDVDRLLDIAAQVGIYVVARPGPYINAETDSGGFPAWVDTLKGRSRSSDADFQAASDEWLDHIDPILARHQYSNGTGTIILYQIENEYGSNTDAAYMAHTEQLVRGHGITVPFTHNHCCGSSTWATGTGAVDIPGQDSYPQGFNCSSPTRWNAVSTLPRFRDDSPVYTPEFQGGAFDPWGGPGYDNCRVLTGTDFENVFYKNNIAGGATMQSFYMTYGGTSWGWLPDPAQVYTSYDYGAAITETRQLTPKYDEAKRIGYFVNSVAPLTKTDAFATTPPERAAVLEQARINPDDGTQFLTLRHKDSTATTTDATHISIDLGARSTYTWDDRDPALRYQGTWSHVGSEVNYTGGDYQQTESFSNTAGDSVAVDFTGTAVRWISSNDQNHGIADVYLDGTKVATVDGYGASKATQQVFYQAHGLTDGPHTLRIAVTGRQSAAATGHFVVVDAIDVPPPGSSFYPVVPQQPGTAITLAGRDAKVLVANYAMDSQRLVYSTSEIMTHAHIGAQDVALLYGRDGQAGETVLRYPARPAVQVLAGSVSTVWDGSRGDLRLNYVHSGLARVLVTPAGGTPLLLLLATDEQAATFWREDTAAGPVLVRGPYLTRTAAVHGGLLQLTGDTSAATDVEIFAPPSILLVTWNGAPVALRNRAGLRGRLGGPKPVTLPALTRWRFQFETPEADPAFDDSQWTVADHLTTNNPSPPATPPVLYADDYGFHHGDVWYRGRFTGTARQTGVQLSAVTGNQGVYSAWLNGVYLGSSGAGSAALAFPPGALRVGRDNVLAVLVEDMGHNEDFNANDTNKEPRGLTSATVTGAPLTALTWRLQGNSGGEQIVDPVRGPMNVTGLYGQRAGWSLPGYPDRSWAPVTLPHTMGTAGVGWYRTTVDLHLPQGQDTSLGIRIADDPARHYRAQLYVNGWLIGRYINDVGPQHSFPVPAGILRSDGRNTIAIAVWGTDAGGGLGSVSLESYGSEASPLRVADVDGPGYDPRVYPPARPAAATVALSTPDTVTPGATVDVSATFSGTASGVTLAVPDGWSATRTGAASWRVTAPATGLQPVSFLKVTATYQVHGRTASTSDTRAVRALPSPPAQDSWLSDLPFLSASNGWGPVERDTSNGENAAGDGHTITLNGVTYPKGLGVHPASDVGFYLGGRCGTLAAVVGVDDEVGSSGSVRFHVLVDGAEVWSSGVLTGADAGLPVSVSVAGGQQLDLVVDDGGDGNGLDHSDWAAAKVACS
ncbi:MAG TPA: beta-galactosidase [Rugosimonospora sp.]|nr:beta-galactosidase [Rugosimonospora sp.]